MKKRKKKLVLSRETVSRLDDEKVQVARGGFETDTCLMPDSWCFCVEHETGCPSVCRYECSDNC